MVLTHSAMCRRLLKIGQSKARSVALADAIDVKRSLKWLPKSSRVHHNRRYPNGRSGQRARGIEASGETRAFCTALPARRLLPSGGRRRRTTENVGA